MSEKSVQKRKYILETARKVFIEKGYKGVSMKDIVEACEISRGGLYLYFSDTDEIFLEVLKMESEEADDVFSVHMGKDATAADILSLFLAEQKKELLRIQETLAVASYEYLFSHTVAHKDNFLRSQFHSAVKILEKLIDLGIESGEFTAVDSNAAAKNIMYVLEGLKISSLTGGVSEETVDREMMILMQGLIIEE